MLTLAALRARWTGLLGPFVAITLAVAIMSITGLIHAAARPRVPDRLAGAAVLVQSPPAAAGPDVFAPTRPWSAERASELAGRLSRLPGVATAVVDHPFYAQLVVGGRPQGDPPADEPLGHGWSAAALGAYELVTGTPPARPGTVAVDRRLGVGPGATVTVLTAGGPGSYTVSGTVAGPGLWFPDATAAALAGGPRLIGLVTAPGADVAAIAAAARTVVGADGRVLTGAGRAAAEPPSHARIRWIGQQVLAALAALGGFVSIFIVSSTAAFAVSQRRRELGLLRAVGATARQVRRSVYAETLLVAALGAATGALLGALLAPVAGGVLVDGGFQPPTFRATLTWWPLAGALVAGPLVALAGAWTAARRAARVRPLEALREAAVEIRVMSRSRWLAGGLATLLGLLLTARLAAADDVADLADQAPGTAAALITGMTLLAPVVVPPVVRLVTWPLSRTVTAGLARAHAVTAVRRTAATAAPVLVTVGLATLIAGMVQTTTAAYAARRAAVVDGIAVGVAVPAGAPGLSDATVAGLPGLALLPTTLWRGTEPVDALGVDPAALAPYAPAGRVRAGSLAGFGAPDSVVVTESTGLAVGATVPVGYADGGTGTVRVVAVLDDAAAPAPVLLPRATVRAHDPAALTSAVYLTARPGGDVLAGRLLTVPEHARLADADEDRLVWTFTLVLLVVAVGYAALAVANTLLMAAAGRRSELATLRRVGATRTQVLGAVAAESTLVVLIGAGLGLLVAVIALLGTRAGLSAQAGAAVPLVVPVPVVAGAIGLCLVLAVTATVLPMQGRAPSYRNLP